MAPLALGGSAGHFGVTFAFVGGDVVFLLELLAADVAGELVEGVGVVFLHVPVEGGFLAAGEAADLAPGKKTEGSFKVKESKMRYRRGRSGPASSRCCNFTWAEQSHRPAPLPLARRGFSAPSRQENASLSLSPSLLSFSKSSPRPEAAETLRRRKELGSPTEHREAKFGLKSHGEKAQWQPESRRSRWWDQYLLQRFLPGVDAPVDDQVAAGTKGTGAELADVVPLVCGAEEKKKRIRG